MVETRAQGLGVKPKVIIRQTKRLIDVAQKKLEQANALWCDVYGGIEGDIDDLISQLDRLRGETMDEAAEYLNEPWSEF